MTNQDILKAVIEKVENGGFNAEKWLNKMWKTHDRNTLIGEGLRYWKFYDFLKTFPETLIFSHDFAKAFFPKGEKFYPHWDAIIEEYDKTKGAMPYKESIKTIPLWQYHLQQMVLEEDKLQYLKKFI